MGLFPEKCLLGFCTWNVVYRAKGPRAIHSPGLINNSERLIRVEFHIVVIFWIERVLWLSFSGELVTIGSRPLNIVRREAQV